jgi:hypothetical protein
MSEKRSKNLELTNEASDMKLAELKAAFQKRMANICQSIADRKAGKGVNFKVRISAIARTLGISHSRAKQYYYQESRRIDVEEFFAAQQAHEKLAFQEAERAAIRALEMANSSLLFADSAIDEHDSEGAGSSLPTSREMAQELRIRLAEV